MGLKIAQVIKEGGGWGNLDPSILQKGVGGREGALIRLATEWARLGHEVTNFVPVQKAIRLNEYARRDEENYGGVPYGAFRGAGEAMPKLFRDFSGFHEYIPTNLAKPMLRNFPFDAVVAWECPSVFADDDICEKQKVRLVHMQVAHLEEQAYAEQFSTGIVALSEWAKDFLIHDGLSMDGSKMYVRPNGVNIDEYPKQEKKFPNKNFSVVYSSSPDRGLVNLLQIWPEIRKTYKKANLFVAYGVNRFTEQIRWSHGKVGEMCVEIEEGMKQPGVIDVGKIGQEKLASLQMKASMWLYPADTIQATETGCITAIENMAAGNPCVMTDVDCLESEFKNYSKIVPLPWEPTEFLHAAYSYMGGPTDYHFASVNAREFAESRSWSKIAPTWIDLFKDNHG